MVSSIIINVKGTTGVGLSNVALSNLPQATRIVWNFYQASEVTLSSVSVWGAILAPYATISQPNGNINGQIIALNLNGPIELHNSPFVGCLPL